MSSRLIVTVVRAIQCASLFQAGKGDPAASGIVASMGVSELI